MISDIVPNPFVGREIAGATMAALRARGFDDAKLGEYTRKNSFKTVVGDVKFGKGGEWAEPRVLQVQFRDVKSGDVEQFRTMDTQVVVSPDAFASGKVIYPFADARK